MVKFVKLSWNYNAFKITIRNIYKLKSITIKWIQIQIHGLQIPSVMMKIDVNLWIWDPNLLWMNWTQILLIFESLETSWSLLEYRRVGGHCNHNLILNRSCFRWIKCWKITMQTSKNNCLHLINCNYNLPKKS